MADVFIHPTAIISEDVSIGEGTRIWHHAQVREHARIGKNCIIGKGVYIDTGVSIGDECKIQNYACVYQGVTIGNKVFIGPHAVFTNDLYPRSWLWGAERLMRTEVREGASIGANATIVCGVTVGSYAMVGAGAVVSEDVPAHVLVLGNPGKVKGFVCVCGHTVEEREGERVCPACGTKMKVNV